MRLACPAPDPGVGMVRDLLDSVDCGVRSFSQGGYETLVQPPSPFPAIVTALLTIYVALIGWGLLSGRGPRLADTPAIVVKIAMILALTISWPLFQGLVFRVAFDGGLDLSRVILGAAQQSGDPWAALQTAVDQIGAAANAFAAQASPDPQALRSGPALAAELLWSASAVLLAATLGVVLVAKIIVGVLTATGPFFIALALVETTRGLLAGWIRALAATALAPLVASLVCALLLSLLAPRLALLTADLEAGRLGIGPAVTAASLVFVFAAAQAGLLLAMAVVALGFRLPTPVAAATGPSSALSTTLGAPGEPQQAESRARAVAMAVGRSLLETANGEPASRRLTVALTAGAAPAASPGSAHDERLGQTYRRLKGPAAPRGGPAGDPR